MANDLEGKRIELISTTDPYTDLKPGARGTVEFVDDMGTIFPKWDSKWKSSLGLVPGEDRYKIVEESPEGDTFYDEVEMVQSLTKELEDAGCEVGWSDLEGLALEALADGSMDRYYIMARFETSHDMAGLIMAVLDNFRP
jgi:hypothetical protein